MQNFGKLMSEEVDCIKNEEEEAMFWSKKQKIIQVTTKSKLVYKSTRLLLLFYK